MSEEEERYLALSMQAEGDKAAAMLISSLSQCEVLNMCYAYKYRVKSEKDLTSKVVRKLKANKDDKDDKEYKLSDITDVVGIRFVTLFRNELAQVLELLIKIIQYQEQLTPNPFVENSFEEMIFYTANAYDSLEVKIGDMLEKYDVKVERNGGLKTVISPQGYSSLHLVSRLENKIDTLSSGDSPYYIPVEIQIRTVFEDAWGEIDHKYGYVIREGKDSEVKILNPEHVLNHLKVLKKFSDACAEYADEIYSEATIDVANEIEPGEVISVSTDEEVLLRFEELGVSEHRINIYKQARLYREKAKGLIKESRSLGVSQYLESAKLSHQLTKDIDESALSPDSLGEYLFYYYSKMNEAICLLSINTSEHNTAAFYIYNHIAKVYPLFPLLRMRLAQAYGKIGRIEESLVNFTKAKNLIKDFEAGGNQYNDTLPETDYQHIKKYLPKIFGYQLWHKQHYMEIQSNEDKCEKIKLLKQAYDVTKELLSDLAEDQKWSVHNNLLYYALELVSLNLSEIEVKELDKNIRSHCEIDVKELDKNIRSHFEVLESCVVIETETNVDKLDTLSKAYEYLGKTELAELACDKLIPLALDGAKNDSYKKEDMLEIAQEALMLKQSYMSQRS